MRDFKGRYTNKRMTALDRLVVLGMASFTISCGWWIDHNSITAVASNLPDLDSSSVSRTIVSSSPALVTTMQTAGEAIPQPVQATTPKASIPGEYDALLEQIFGDKADEAKQIMLCESGGRSENVGDTHLFVTRSNGDRVGDSIGLFQIRTGGREFNRARSSGMTPDEFRDEMKNPEKNIKYAKSMYDLQGWSPWWNCKQKLGL